MSATLSDTGHGRGSAGCGRSTRAMATALACCALACFGCAATSEESACDGACEPKETNGEYDFIVVGAGAAGGPLAARLARAGKRVLLLEAGDDVGEGLKYRVPAMHALSTEDASMAWWFFVHHHADETLDREDSKFTEQGILYPRGSALGGSTAVNAMVTVLPSRSDWNRIAALTGDASWRAGEMETYYHRVREWLSIEIPDPSLAAGDDKVSRFLAAAAATDANETLGDTVNPLALLGTAGGLGTLLDHDLNEALLDGEASGLYRLPLATRKGRRNGPREFIVDTVRQGFPLKVVTGAFVTGVLWRKSSRPGATPTAAGVEYVRQSHVYGASLAAVPATESPRHALASGEVILSAGAFNSPQLLMLSGVGDAPHLAERGIEAVANRPGVGQNLRDRYEAAVVTEFESPIAVVERCRLGESEAADPCLQDWKAGRGVYQTPGFLATVLRRSSETAPLADLQTFAVPSDARGYYPGYSLDSAASKNRFSWLILKAHTNNTDGRVRLIDASPFSRPDIRFNSYDEQNPLGDPDLLAVVSGVRFIRRVADQMKTVLPDDPGSEIWPGREKASDVDIAEWVRRESWGHHACCTNKMGARDDPNAVVDSSFRVIGTKRLRVVDASVFPEIPGTFLALPIFMVAEKAAETILENQP